MLAQLQTQLRGNSRYFTLFFYFITLCLEIARINPQSPETADYLLKVPLIQKVMLGFCTIITTLCASSRQQPIITIIDTDTERDRCIMWRTVFILQMEQQEKDPESVCVKLVAPAICLLHILQECIQIYHWFDLFLTCFICVSLNMHISKDTPTVSSDKPCVNEWALR